MLVSPRFADGYFMWDPADNRIWWINGVHDGAGGAPPAYGPVDNQMRFRHFLADTGFPASLKGSDQNLSQFRGALAATYSGMTMSEVGGGPMTAPNNPVNTDGGWSNNNTNQGGSMNPALLVAILLRKSITTLKTDIAAADPTSVATYKADITAAFDTFLDAWSNDQLFTVIGNGGGGDQALLLLALTGGI